MLPAGSTMHTTDRPVSCPWVEDATWNYMFRCRINHFRHTAHTEHRTCYCGIMTSYMAGYRKHCTATAHEYKCSRQQYCNGLQRCIVNMRP